MKVQTLFWLGLATTSVIAHPGAVPRFPLSNPVSTNLDSALEPRWFPLFNPSPETPSSSPTRKSIGGVIVGIVGRLMGDKLTGYRPGHPSAPTPPSLPIPFPPRPAQTTSTSLVNPSPTNTANPVPPPGSNVQSTILVLVRDQETAYSATSGLNGYGIPYQVLIVPQAGVALPILNTTAGGNFGGIIIASQVSYDYGNGTYRSALTQEQYDQLYAYQITYGVRMVQFDAYPQPVFGTTPLGGCCGNGVEQTFAFTNTSAFAQAGIRANAGVSTLGLYHYPAQITQSNTTVEVAQFAANSVFNAPSTAAVINNFNGRQQMVIFMSWATDWSATSNFIQHAYITWMTRGLYAGIRRVNLNAQVDDLFLDTPIYYPNNLTDVYRSSVQDLSAIASWVPVIQSKMNPGSYFRPELGHNGNGNIAVAELQPGGEDACDPGPIDTGNWTTPPLEFKKTLGTGVNQWQPQPTTYNYTLNCINLDPLKVWFAKTANRDRFMHLSHTFTHYNLNNATYSDVLKEIQFNQAWLKQTTLAQGIFSANSLIPPAITGLHNGDAIRAWVTAGITNAVGDNSRPLLRSQQNNMWPYITTMASDGYDGFQVIPRYPTRIYYNCDTPACTLQEWINTSAGSGTFTNLMAVEKADTMRYLFGLQHDGYMFHQANFRATGVAGIDTPDGTVVYSLFQAWVEQTVAEFKRLVTWPMISLKQSDLSVSFANRMARDKCGYRLSWAKSGSKITGVTVTADSNTCSAPIPITVPGSVTNTQGFRTEKVGGDPLTIWVQLSGKPVSFILAAPIAV